MQAEESPTQKAKQLALIHEVSFGHNKLPRDHSGETGRQQEKRRQMRETFGLINEEDWNSREHAQEKAMLKKQAMRNQRFSHDYNATSLRVNGPHPKYQRDVTEQQKLQRGKNP